MNMLHLSSPWETEAGNPGEEPAKGYHGQAHQTMRGRGGQLASRPTKTPHRMIDLLCLKNAKNFMQTGVQGTGRGTFPRRRPQHQKPFP